MYPTNNTYIPTFDAQPKPITIEEVRANGKIVALSEDSTKATVEVKIGTQIVYCGVLLNEDGTIKDFIHRPVNKFVKLNPDNNYADQDAE